MRTVLIVDDEILSVRMLTRIIDWENCGIRICASAEDGVEALKQVELHRPDIILTDIRMPRMDGLEFIQKVKERRPETEFILISGYADFSYIKQAMEMGCSHYLLKPVDEKELETAIGSVMEKIGKKERQEEIMEENQKLKIRRQLSLFMRAGGGREEIERLTAQIPSGLNRYRLMGILIEENSINDHVEHASRLSLGLEMLESSLEEELNRNRSCLLLDYEENCFTVMVAEVEGAPFAEWAGEVCDYFLKEFEMVVRICFTLPYDNVSALSSAFLRLSNLERFSFYVGEASVLGYGFNCEENEFDELDFLDRTKVIGQAVAGRDMAAAKEIMAEVLELSVHLNPASLHLVYEFCYNVVCSVRDQLAREERTELLELPVMKLSYRNLSEISTVHELGQFMDEILGCLAGEKGEPQMVYGRMVQEGITYLEEHFDSNISLDSMCAKLAVSKNYFCYLFKRETGESIWSYLTQIRLKKSRELLLTTDYKSYEIAYMVGYDNPSYFSRLFKKCVGQPPNEYRAAHGEKKGVRKG